MDWVKFFEDYSIDYVTRGKNTRRGEASVQCPWCGDDDPSHHLGISLTQDAWGCLRDPAHRGKMPHRLVAQLLGISHRRADAIVQQYTRSDPEAFKPFMVHEEPFVFLPPPEPTIEPPPWNEIRAVGLTKKFWHYMQRRGFDPPNKVIAEYQLKCCLHGRFKERIIFPLYQHGVLRGWTGRALINPLMAPRYLASGEAVKKTLFNYDRLTGAPLLFVVEGPFDAMKIDHYGRPQAHATCGFGTTLTIDQIYLLRQLAPKYSRIVVLFDFDAWGPAAIAADWLTGNVLQGQLPQGVKDPGELSRKDVENLIRMS